uniref:Uncharacterized protein n=1 Tax=Geladintestivirus 6 TaxID=3233138 RepID=A0AAU8MK48_9CAUD
MMIVNKKLKKVTLLYLVLNKHLKEYNQVELIC